MGPPAEPCECWCMHCNRTFLSSEMWFQRVIGDPQGFKGFWMCPTPNCGGAGFCFDIFPTDPDHPANEGWHSTDEDEDEEYDPEELLTDTEEASEGALSTWDPDETKWKQLDEDLGDEDDDLEGEEWKHGLSPGERPSEPEWVEEARREREEEEKKYDQPDLRPRELDWTDREEPQRENRSRGDDDWREDDIPF
jgi:hypothetical protein